MVALRAKKKTAAVPDVPAIEAKVSTLAAELAEAQAEYAKLPEGEAAKAGRVRAEKAETVRVCQERLDAANVELLRARLYVAEQTCEFYARERTKYWAAKAEAKARRKAEAKERYGKRWRGAPVPEWYVKLRQAWHAQFARERAAEAHLLELTGALAALTEPRPTHNVW